MLSCAGREFIGALHIFSVDILVMTGWHYCSSYTCSLIPYSVHCSNSLLRAGVPRISMEGMQNLA